MKTPVNLPIPVRRILRKLGDDINHARRRRRITVALMAERAGISRSTVAKIEKGDPTASMGAYAAALFVLGMYRRLGDVVDIANDLLGQELEAERLPKRIRIPKTANSGDEYDE